MNYFYKLFHRGIKWNAFESISYQTILTTHQIILFGVISCSTYGLIGLIFSLIYLSVTFLNFGFDKSLAPFYTAFFKSKKNFKKLFISQLFFQTLILISFLIFIYLSSNSITNLFYKIFNCNLYKFYDQNSINNLWLIVGLIIFFEGIKKTLKAMAELSFLNKQVAITEVIGIIIYVTFVWFSYFSGLNIDPFVTLIPLIIQSLLSISVFTYLIFKTYKRIGLQDSITENSIVSRIAAVRFASYMNQLSHLLFSGNLLIVFFCHNFGVAKISLLKLINNIAVFLNVILERTFGYTSEALLSNLKSSTIKLKQDALNLATKKLYLVLYGVSIFLLINYKFFVDKYFIDPNIGLLSGYLFLMIILFENFFITYELFFLVEEKPYYLFIVNSLSAIIFYLFARQVSSPSIVILLFLLLIVRIISFGLLRIISRYKLKIDLPYKISFNYLLIYIIVSIFCLFIFNLL